MRWRNPVRAVMIVGLAAALATPSAVTLARSKPAPPPPIPLTPAAAVGLPSRALADAAAFQALMEKIEAASPAFGNGPPGVAQTLRDSSAYGPPALVRDAIAYAAVAALQDQTFVAAVRAAGTSPDNRRLMVSYLIADPRYALLVKGADEAAGLAREAIAEAGVKMYVNGKAVRQASYDLQLRAAWSKTDVLDRPARLKAVEAEGLGAPPDAADHVPALQQAASGAAPMTITAPPMAPPHPELVAKALRLAAIAALGEATDEVYDQVAGLATDRDTEGCLHEAKLNLFQCLAVSRPNYEDVFCIGQHGMMDSGACLVSAVDLSVPLDPPNLGPVVSFHPIKPHVVGKPVVHRRARRR